MSIEFDSGRWARVQAAAAAWWAGELRRPLVQLTVGGRTPDRPQPALPNHHFTAFYDETVSPEQIVDVWDWRLACQRWSADGFPTIWPNYGPGALAAMLGARTTLGERTVWFHPDQARPLAEVPFEIDWQHPWLQRIEALYRAGLERWGGLVLMGMTDLGGNLDLLQTFRPGAELLFDLVDQPEAVESKVNAAHQAWWQAFDHFNGILQPTNPGYSCWPGMYSAEPFYMLQCDFCYMISPEMFDRFVRPELVASCQRLTNPFYHLDGPGQLPHLDSLLAIDELKGIQWVPGDGQPDVGHWPEVYRKIREAGKLIQIFSGQSAAGIGILDILADQLGSAEGICLIAWTSEAELPATEAILARHGLS